MRTFTSNDEIYKFARELIELAKTKGDSGTAALLTNAWEKGGCQISEVLYELRGAFRELLSERNMEYPKYLRDDFIAAIKYIDRAFKKANRPF